MTTNAPQNPDRISVFADQRILGKGTKHLIHERHLLHIENFGAPQ
jgi:hypothetical protein